MLSDFRAFILRGSVVDLAVGIVIGAAFGAVVASFVENMLTPLIAIPGEQAMRFEEYSFTIGSGEFRYGEFTTDVIAFILVAAAVFFFVVRPVISLMERYKTEPETDSPTKECSQCLSKIPEGAARCAYCTSSQ